MKDEEGGFTGGQNQLGHLASCYAALMVICLIGTPEAYQLL